MKKETVKHIEEKRKGLKKYKWDIENLRELAKKVNVADKDAYNDARHNCPPSITTYE